MPDDAARDPHTLIEDGRGHICSPCSLAILSVGWTRRLMMSD
jgi:hypothetical protein